DDDNFMFTMCGLPTPVSWLGSRNESVVATMLGIVEMVNPATHRQDYAVITDVAVLSFSPSNDKRTHAYKLQLRAMACQNGVAEIPRMPMSTITVTNLIQNVHFQSVVYFKNSGEI
ncbi:hypothetical protein Tco_0758979, partial [Tanacetum coccineum]